MNMEPSDSGAQYTAQSTSEAGQNQPTTNQFQAYYPTETAQPSISKQIGGLSGHPMTKQITEFMKQRNVIYATIISVLLISAVVLMFMIPQSTEPIEGTWIKADGQRFVFDDDNGFSNQIYPGSTYDLSGDDLIMTSTVQIIDNNQLVTKLIVQTVEVSFSDDGKAMWWIWQSVAVDNEFQQLDANACSLLIKTSVAKNTFEFGVNAPDYQSDKPSMCQ